MVTAAAAAAATSQPCMTPGEATASTSQPCLAPAEDGDTNYLVDAEELEYKNNKRKLELELLTSQIEAQQAIKSGMLLQIEAQEATKIAMQDITDMCRRQKLNLEKLIN